MFDKRTQWIPAYFKDTPLSALMHTTSRSETENHFFQSFMNKNSNLLTFMCKFDTEMDKQRKTQSTNDYDSLHKRPSMETQLPFKAQASMFYTPKIFGIV